MNGKFLRNHLLILLGYTVLFELLSFTEKNGGSMVVLMGMMVAVAVHVGVLLLGMLISLFGGEKTRARDRLLGALMIGIVGFGTCWGAAGLAELWSGPANFH